MNQNIFVYFKKIINDTSKNIKKKKISLNKFILKK